MLNTSDTASLFEVHKAERRERILAAARRQIARRGVEALTLRELAAASSVSVPTIYNLIGGKHAILVALLEQTMARVAGKLDAARAGGLVERVLALGEAGWSEMLAEPSYFRGLMHAFLVSAEALPLRREIDARNIALMTGVLMAAQADGELADWVDAHATAGALYYHYIVTTLGWAAGEIDDDALPPTVTHGMCLILLGIARGGAARTLERLARESQHKARPPSATAAKGARS
jgi:AcrR family transcriptional regulator